jgi:hypothetical protein
MIGYGIASSLVHEVGHQGAALLGLVESLRPELERRRFGGVNRTAWTLWGRWISEVVADLWSIGKVGIGSTMGLIGLVSLPRRFVFRCSFDDPHPFPWIRVLLSAAIGRRLYPHPQWDHLTAVWRALYPTAGLSSELIGIIEELRKSIPGFVSLLVDHRPAALKGRSLGDVLYTPDRRPDELIWQFWDWQSQPNRMALAPPTLAFAVIGQARASGLITPERESHLLQGLITSWAVTSAFATARSIAETNVPMPLGQPAIWLTGAPGRKPKEFSTIR